MRVFSPWAMLTVLLLLSRFQIEAGAYAVDNSCKPYDNGHDKQDKTETIKSAMAAARNMAVSAANRIHHFDIDLLDNTKNLLFPKSTASDWNSIQGTSPPSNRLQEICRFHSPPMLGKKKISALNLSFLCVDKYQSMITNTPWTVTSEGSISRDTLTIYCGDANFSPNPEAGSNVWTDLTTLANVYSTVHNGAQHGSLCQPGSLGQTLDSMEAQNPIPSEQGTHIIVLCDETLTKGGSPESTGSQPSVSTINALGGAAGLYPGKLIDNVVYASCIASVLLHELMHVTQSSSCK